MKLYEKEILIQRFIDDLKRVIENGDGEKPALPWKITNRQLLEELENNSPYADEIIRRYNCRIKEMYLNKHKNE